MSKPKINKIVLEVGGKKLEFTPKEAKELKGILSDLFGGEKITYVDRWHGYWPWPWYQGGYYSGGVLYNYCNTAATQSNLGNIQTTLTGGYSGNTWSGNLNSSSGVATFTALQG